MTTPAITIETQGRRHYLRGDTYPHKGTLRDAGCRWDPDAKAWWTGKRALAEQLAERLAADTPAESPRGGERKAPEPLFPRRPANALNVEIGAPMDRCRLRTPEHWSGVDPRGARWLYSGGSPLVLGTCCCRECPRLTNQ